MLDNSSKNAAPHPTDPLSDMLKGMRMEGVDYGRCTLSDPWGFSFAAQDAAYFYFIGENGCWLRVAGDEFVRLNVGDAVLLPRGSAHILVSQADVPVEPFPRQQCKPISDGVFDLSAGGDGYECTLFHGTMRFSLDSLHPLLQLMPEVMRVNDLMSTEPTIPHLLDAIGKELSMDRVGACGIVARLADVLAAQIIRSWVEHGCGDSTGWIAAVRSPEVGRVLAHIHSSPAREWQVSELASLMGASRSSFAAKFLELVGETPGKYVEQVRMYQARQWLQQDKSRISEVARRLGFESEATFSRAFKRVVGTTPSQFRSEAIQRSHGLAEQFSGG